MQGVCESSMAYKGHHEPHVEGTPRSAMTWYVCSLCGKREPRGQGSFHGMPRNDPPTLEQRVTAIEEAMKSSNANVTGLAPAQENDK